MTRDEALIAQRCGAAWVKIIPECEVGAPPHYYVMATFGTRKPRHTSKRVWLPLKLNWREKLIEHFLSERERA